MMLVGRQVERMRGGKRQKESRKATQEVKKEAEREADMRIIGGDQLLLLE